MLSPDSGVRQQRGSSLIEVLITMLLLSFAMLAMANLHATSMRYVKMSEFRGIATGLAMDLADRMRANRPRLADPTAIPPQAADANYYNFTTAYSSSAAVVAVPGCAVAAVCTRTEMAAIDLAELRNAAIRDLPGGFIRVEHNAANTRLAMVWIMWLDPEGANDASSLLPCPFVATPQPQCVAMRVSM